MTINQKVNNGTITFNNCSVIVSKHDFILYKYTGLDKPKLIQSKFHSDTIHRIINVIK